MDKFIVKARPKVNHYDTRATIKIDRNAYEKVRKLSFEANVPIVQLLTQMIDFCVDRLQVVEPAESEGV